MTNDQLAALLVTLPLVALAIYDIKVALVVRRAERMKPAIAFLTGVKWLIYAVCVGAVIGAFLGLNSAVFYLTELRLIPPPVPFLLLYGAVIAGSVGVYLLRIYLRKVAPEADR